MWKKILIGVGVFLVLVVGIATCGDKDSTKTPEETKATKAEEVTIVEITTEEPIVTTTTEPTTTTTTKKVANESSQAVRMAKDYLSLMSFSRQGLVKQLEYEGFTNEQAIYGVDNAGADWNVQAVKSAKEYLELMSFSRQGLIDQLKYEGFTSEQATYGVDNCGATW